MRKGFRYVFVGVLGVLTLLSSCNDEITDLFEAIKDYGYRIEDPLGPKKVKLDETLIGGYVYNDLPVIIEQKSAYLYSIKFLTTSVYKEDRVIEGHISDLGKYRFLNLNMGDYYCIVKPVLSPDGYLRMSLVRSALESEIPANKLKSYLTKHGGNETYEYTDSDGESREMNVYSTFSFEKVTPAKAYQLQEEELYSHKMSLYEDCKSIKKYNRLAELFPPDKSMKMAGHSSVLRHCETYQEVELFIESFPRSPVIDEARLLLEELKTAEMEKEWYRQDSLAFYKAKDQNTIQAYKSFLIDPKTDKFNERAEKAISSIAAEISNEDIEWKWTNGEAEQAMQYIFYKIDYAPLSELDFDFLVNRMTLYSLKALNRQWREKVIDYFGKMAAMDVGNDVLLDIYMGKGFVLWSLPKLDLVEMTFKSKISDSYQRDGVSFKAAFKTRFKFYTKEEGISFPEQKSTYKKLKKLK